MHIKSNYKKIVNKDSSIYAFGELFNQLIPVIIFPILLAKIGLESLGGVILYQIIIGYGFLFMFFGLRTYGATSLIRSKTKNQLKSRLSTIIFLYLSIFLLISIIIILILLFFGEELKTGIILIFSILGSFLISNSFYIGLQKLKAFTFTVIFSKVIYLFIIILFVDKETNIIDIILYRSIPNIFIGILGFKLIGIIKIFSFNFINLRLMKYYITKGFYFLISDLTISFKDKAHYFLVNEYIGLSAVAILDGGQKLIVLLHRPSAIISSVLLKTTSQKNTKIEFSFILIILLISIFGYSIFYIFNGIMFEYALKNMSSYVWLFKIYLLSVFPLSLSSFFIQNYIIPRGWTKIVVNNSIVTTTFYILFTVILIVLELYTLKNAVVIILLTYSVELFYITKSLFYTNEKN